MLENKNKKRTILTKAQSLKSGHDKGLLQGKC